MGPTFGLDSNDRCRFLLSSKSLEISLSFSSIILSARSRNELCSSYKLRIQLQNKIVNSIDNKNKYFGKTNFIVKIVNLISMKINILGKQVL